MALRYADRVRDTSTTTGTGNVTVSGSAPSTYITFSAIPSITISDTFTYGIASQTANEWETGIGTWLGTNTFARTIVLQSSNSNALVTFSAGTKDVWLGLSTSLYQAGAPTGGGTDGIFYLNDQTVTASYLIPTGKNAGTFGPVTINSGVTVTVPSGSTWTVF